MRPPAAPLMAAPRRVAAPAVAPIVDPASSVVEPSSGSALTSAGVAPAAIWLVEKGPQWELYSNGLRIDTGLTVKGSAARFPRLRRARATLEPHVRNAPVGLLFHTSESDVWPLEAAYNENLRGTSQGLLRYVQKNRLYHYVIDRFGRVYRVVAEESKANHAGHSVWASAGRVYLNLNHAFLGVSFETRWEGAKALPITQAQLAAGRNLSDYLRQRYEIAPEMCVTHGLTSVNPQETSHRTSHGLGARLPVRRLRPARPVPAFGAERGPVRLRLRRRLPEGARRALARRAASRRRRSRARPRARTATWRTCATSDRPTTTGGWRSSRPRTGTRRAHPRPPGGCRGVSSRP